MWKITGHKRQINKAPRSYHQQPKGVSSSSGYAQFMKDAANSEYSNIFRKGVPSSGFERFLEEAPSNSVERQGTNDAALFMSVLNFSLCSPTNISFTLGIFLVSYLPKIMQCANYKHEY